MHRVTAFSTFLLVAAACALVAPVPEVQAQDDSATTLDDIEGTLIEETLELESIEEGTGYDLQDAAVGKYSINVYFQCEAFGQFEERIRNTGHKIDDLCVERQSVSFQGTDRKSTEMFYVSIAEYRSEDLAGEWFGLVSRYFADHREEQRTTFKGKTDVLRENLDFPSYGDGTFAFREYFSEDGERFRSSNEAFVLHRSYIIYFSHFRLLVDEDPELEMGQRILEHLADALVEEEHARSPMSGRRK